MNRWDMVRAMLRMAKLVIALALTLGLVGCSLGEAVMPDPAPGVTADRSVGVVAPVPAPIPHSLEQRQECFTCHAIGAVDAPAVPADHEQDVTLCTTCHAVWLAPAIAAAAPPAIPHELEGREDCLPCHKLGTADAPAVPDNHNGLVGDICLTCHTPMTEVAGGGGEEVAVAEIPEIPHGLEGFDACTQCHEEGGPGIPQFPEDHVGRTDDLCTACHRPAVEGAQVTVAPEATPTASQATPEATPEVASTPEPTAVPEDTPAEAAGDVASGQELFAARCAACHGPEGEGTGIAPEALNDADWLADHSDEDLREAVLEGVDGSMPAFSQLSDQEVLDLIALLRSWQ
jgi:mono/diheme cytochrome c family protein